MKGFTLIESLVVVFIILVLTLITLPNYRQGEKALSLEQSILRLSQDLRRAEDMALSAKEFQGAIPQGGYGLYADSDSPASYIIFADCNRDHEYSNGRPCAGVSEEVETVSLASGVEILSLTPTSPLNIAFTPPYPTVTIPLAATEATITLALKDDPSQTRTVRVNKAGLIAVE